MPKLTDLIPSAFKPTKTLGVGGTPIYDGQIQSKETHADLQSGRKYITYSNTLANMAIVAAGVRYFLNLLAKPTWAAVPADDSPRAAELAEWVEKTLKDMETPWRRVIRRGGMFKFYGFSVQEWTAKKRMDGSNGFFDISPRPQRTIERWVPDETGRIVGVIQRSPQTQREIPLPRNKLIYTVDDSLDDSPEGLGLFRHIAETARRLKRYQELEAMAFETDLKGVPVGRAPLGVLESLVKEGKFTKAEANQMVAPLREFMQNHVRNPELGLILDSAPYTTEDEKETPSASKQWDLDLLKGSGSHLEQVASAINRLHHEIAWVLGVDHLLLGSEGTGSYALAREKSHNFYLIVNSALEELAETHGKDTLRPLWKLNGFPPELMPTFKVEEIRFRDVEQITAALKDMAAAGAPLDPEDPAIGEIRDLLGLSRPVLEAMLAEATLRGGKEPQKVKEVDEVTDVEDTEEDDTGSTE